MLPFFDNSAPAVYKIQGPWAQDFYTPLALNCQKGQHLPALEVYKNQSPTMTENTMKENLRIYPFSALSRCFPYPLCGYPLWTLPLMEYHDDSIRIIAPLWGHLV